MVGAVAVTLVGTLGGDPETRNVGGATVANFSVAVSERKYNRDTSAFEDAGTTWYRCAAWRDVGEHIASSLGKGDRIIVQGTLRSREYEKDGAKSTAWEVEVEDAGPSLRFATATVARRQGGGQQGRQAPAGQGRAAQPVQQDTWSQPGQYADEQPF